MSTAYLTHPFFHAHAGPVGHPECPQRLTAVEDRLRADQIYDLLQHHQPAAAGREQLLRVHSARLLDELRALSPAAGLVALDPDTFMTPDSLAAARLAAGAAVLATELVIAGRADNAFCAVRPPGHHAEHDRAMGFCLLNNIAVAAAHALEARGLERVAILDFDVHHGNGTEDIFRADERVMLCSTFQHPFYPFGGVPAAREGIINAPLPAGAGGEQFRDAISAQWLPALARFRPQMIFVSAGFDGHIEDELAELRLVDDDYRWVSETIMSIAERHAGGRIVSSLEGGYALDALGRCASAHVRALARL